MTTITPADVNTVSNTKNEPVTSEQIASVVAKLLNNDDITPSIPTERVAEALLELKQSKAPSNICGATPAY